MALHFPPKSDVSHFHHRLNSDGNWDSICLKCFLTAARAKTEMVLTREEQEHVCSHSLAIAEPEIPPWVLIPVLS